MKHFKRLTPTSILIMTMPFAMGENAPSHNEAYMDSEQFKIEIEVSKQDLISAVEHYNLALELQMEASMLAMTK